ncbi:MAG: hypothetical protein A2138_11955 [Deltaproteobacteria bacterium RBG_16_71_12]|nr:MAG: hypothetical protein A2138_11955 [Deltaproteobacteria bacterium RBG_16_71_12]
MNFLAHALPHLHDPWMVAGTSLPDWLRVVQRGPRLRPARLLAMKLPDGSPAARLRAGVLRHHDDDLRFHLEPGFERVTAELTRQLRALEPDPRFRASTIAHIVVEMLVDAALLRLHPGSGERYYGALRSLDGAELARAAEALTCVALPRLHELHERFLDARFVLEYRSNEGVLRSLEAVLVRTGLPPTPPGTLLCIEKARPSVRTLTGALFPP